MDSRDGLRSSWLTPQGCEEVEHSADGLEVASVQGFSHRCCVGRNDCLDGASAGI